MSKINRSMLSRAPTITFCKAWRGAVMSPVRAQIPNQPLPPPLNQVPHLVINGIDISSLSVGHVSCPRSDTKLTSSFSFKI